MQINPNDIRKIVVISLAGLGNTLLFLPTLRELRRRLPQAEIHALCASAAARELFEGLPEIRRVFQLLPRRQTTFADKLGAARQCLALRRNGYDLSITVFPSNRIEYAIVAFLVGARFRLMHRYTRGDHLRNLHWLVHADVAADPRIHDVLQNFNLLRHICGGPTLEPRAEDLRLQPDLASEKEASRLFREWGLDGQRIVGFHVTSYPDMAYKRWEAGRFRELIRRLADSRGCAAVVFGTADERSYIQTVIFGLQGRVVGGTGTPFWVTAALVRRCSAFVSNDSGLMHLAVCMNVPTVGIFGPTNPVRTAPYGPQHEVVRTGIACSPCHLYPFTDSPLLAGCTHLSCMRDLKVEDVFEAVVRCLSPRAA